MEKNWTSPYIKPSNLTCECGDVAFRQVPISHEREHYTVNILRQLPQAVGHCLHLQWRQRDLDCMSCDRGENKDELYMGVSLDGGTPKSSILIGFSI